MNFLPRGAPEGCRKGMNDLEEQKKSLGPEVCRLLENGYPGPISFPREGMADKIANQTCLGYGTNYSLFRPNGVYYKKGSKEFLLAWAHSTADSTEYHLEAWNITDNTRTRILQLDMPNSEEYLGMLVLYDAVYLVLEHEATANRTTSGLTKNMILEYNATSGSWDIIEMMISIAPTVSAIKILSAALPPESRTDSAIERAVVWRNEVWAVCSTADGISEVWKFTGFKWVFVKSPAISSSLWGARTAFAMVVHKDYLYVMGGKVGATYRDDVWRSSDGETWTRVADGVAWPDQAYHTALSYGGNLYVMGGRDASNVYDDVYESTDDGANWTLVQGSAAFGQLYGHSSVVFDEKMWVIGGRGLGFNYDDVYYSTDGVTWTLAAGAPGWSARYFHASAVYDGKIWVSCGLAGSWPNDVWYSADGATWTEATDSYPTNAASHSLVSLDGKLYSLGQGTRMFQTSDGATWSVVAFPIGHFNFRNYAFTFVRRTDSASILSSYDDYVYPPWEEFDGETIVGPDEVLLTGTVDLASNGDLTGSGTSFVTELSLTTYLRIAGCNTAFRVTGITNATTATVQNVSNHVISSAKFAKLPALEQRISTNVWNIGISEGIEDSDGRQCVAADLESIEFGVAAIPMPSNHSTAIARGATHMRVWGTIARDSLGDREIAQGLALRYIEDIAIDADNFDADSLWLDRTTDNALEGETHILEATGYEPCPQCRYLHWDSSNGRMIAFGDPNNEGYAYVSTAPSDSANPIKYASWYDADSLFLNCETRDNQQATGIVSLAGDTFFFKERSIFLLDNGDVNSKPRPISETVGCACPQSLRVIELPGVTGFCVFFISAIGPYLLTAGGRLRPFYEFTIKALWRDGVVLRNTDGSPTDWHTRNKVWAAMHANTLWVLYGDSEDSSSDLQSNTIYGYHMGKDEDSRGPMKISIPAATTPGCEEVVFEPQMLFSIDDVRAYALSHVDDEYDAPTWRCTRFLKPGVYQDVYTTCHEA